MQKLNILNTREVQKINELLQHDFGFHLGKEYVCLRSDHYRIFIINKELGDIDVSKLRIDKAGLYFGEMKPNQLRLSKEGAQLLALQAGKAKKALKNVVSLNAEEVKSYFQGNDLEKDLGSEHKLVLLRYQQDILGCAQYKDTKIINFLPKIHRGEVIL